MLCNVAMAKVHANTVADVNVCWLDTMCWLQLQPELSARSHGFDSIMEGGFMSKCGVSKCLPGTSTELSVMYGDELDTKMLLTLAGKLTQLSQVEHSWSSYCGTIGVCTRHVTVSCSFWGCLVDHI